MYMFSQEQIFILFLIIGILIGIFFDIFRAFRKTFKTSDFITNLQDICFIAIAGILIVNSIITFNNGQVRFYIFLALFFGSTLYFLSISRFCISILHFFMNIFKKIIFFPFFVNGNIKKKKDFK